VSETGVEFARLVRLLVDHGEAVHLDEIHRGGGETRFELSVDPDDMGRVIGRQGRTAHALRSLLAARAARDGERYELEILED